MASELLKKIRRLEKKSNLTDDESCELEHLSDRRQQEINALFPRPTCCEEMRAVPAVQLTVDFEDVTKPMTAKWYIAIPEVWQHADHKWWQKKGTPKFCPFCATPLPVMVLKNPIPANIQTITDGGYYCSTCRERLQCCVCDPISSAFEPKR